MSEILIKSNKDSENLTEQELRILGYVARGFLNKEIGRELDIAEQTVKNHLYDTYQRLELYGHGSRIKAVKWYTERYGPV